MWHKTVDGLTAQMILCDQICRNIFRGDAEAFEYCEISEGIARNLANFLLDGGPSSSVSGEVYPPYMCIIVLTLMHSEDLADHELSLKVLNHASRTSPHLAPWWDKQIPFEIEHKEVVERFGRYPHRNKAKGRESTPEELEWLADVDNLPRWAK
jgi:uncharacterized protein (DUF924 family)